TVRWRAETIDGAGPRPLAGEPVAGRAVPGIGRAAGTDVTGTSPAVDEPVQVAGGHRVVAAPRVAPWTLAPADGVAPDRAAGAAWPDGVPARSGGPPRPRPGARPSGIGVPTGGHPHRTGSPRSGSTRARCATRRPVPWTGADGSRPGRRRRAGVGTRRPW